MIIRASDFFEIPKSLAIFSHYFRPDGTPWSWLPDIENALLAHSKCMRKKHVFWEKIKKLFSSSKAVTIGKNVHIGKNVQLPITCTIEDNVYIGDGTKIRSGALIRKNVIIGEHCVIGNSCEIKNSLLMDHVQVAHFNYIGDSILGSHAHLAAGAVLSNLRFDRQPIAIKIGNEKISTEFKKLGAVLGEYAQVGCNSTLFPGTFVGKNSIVSTGLTFGGFLEANRIAYAETKILVVEREKIIKN